MAKFYYGGQAVLEGVMMRGQHNMAVAVRRPAGDITVSVKPLAAAYRSRWRRMPLIRGILVLVESIAMGTQVLFDSAKMALGEEEEAPSSGALWGAVALGAVFAVALFFVAPMLLTRYLVNPYIESNILSHIIEGVIRVGLFVGYLAAIGLMRDIRRVFAYHGAEHKTVNAFEGGVPLEVEAVRRYSTAHTRCGTSFILIVLVLAIIVFAFIGQPSVWQAILYRIVLIPVIASLGYEVTRIGAAWHNNKIVHAIFVPGLLLQSMTTRPPDDSQIEVAVTALKSVIEADTPSSDRTASLPEPIQVKPAD